MALLVLFMVFLSGLTGLVYQITWQKYLSIYLGSHALSTSLTLSCFFLFLALGYHVVGRFGHLLGRNRIRTYAFIEGIIGAYAIFSPQMFSTLYEVWPSYASDSLPHFLSSAGFALLLMGLPTFLMGGTIPLLTQGMSQELSEGHRVHAWVYGINTLGAFIGTLIAGFFLVEKLGLEQSLNMTGIINCVLCVALILYCKISPRKFEGYVPDDVINSEKIPFALLAVAFLSGFLSFGLESLLIRMAGISMGSSNYTYTIIVGTFIICIAIGSIFSSVASDRNGLRWLITTQVLLVGSVGVLCLLVPIWPDFFMRTRMLFASSEINFTPYWISTFFGFLLFLLLPVTLLGMTLPLLFQQLKRQGQLLSQTAGKMYAYNSIGATLGAIVLGYLAFFVLTAQQVFALLVVVAALNCWLIISASLPHIAFYFKYLPLLGGLAIAYLLPPWQDLSFIPSRYFSSFSVPPTQETYENFLEGIHDKDNNKILYSNYGVNTYTVVSENKSGERSVYVNGKPDASTAGDRFTRTMTALIPLSLAKENKDIFIIGLGSGMSTGIAAAFNGTESVRVSEIASGVIKALPYFEKWNFKLKDNMNKVEIVNDDAYKVLKNDKQTYDLIFSEPSNTWVTGVEKIYTQEYLSQAAKRLRPHGIYSQWFPLFSMSEASFLSIIHNFKLAFNHVTLWSAKGAATIILASHEPIEVDLESMKQKAVDMQDIYKSVKRSNGIDLLYHQIWSDPAMTDLARQAKIPHSLYHPTLSYESGRAFFTSNQVGFSELARKYFVNSQAHKEKVDNLPISRTISSHGSDQLLWETVADELPKEFYVQGITYLSQVQDFFGGKLGLTKNRLFPADPTEKAKEIIRSKKTKLQQYDYLLSNGNKRTPETVEKEAPLGNELFSRYLYLVSMREKPQLAKVLSHIPTKCDGEKDVKTSCLLNKLEILRFIDPSVTDQLNNLGKSVATNQSEGAQELETLYKDMTQDYKDL